jgi:hypothetical protein
MYMGGHSDVVLNQIIPTKWEEDNAECVFALNVTQMTRNLKHIETIDGWVKDKVADKTCTLLK